MICVELTPAVVTSYYMLIISGPQRAETGHIGTRYLRAPPGLVKLNISITFNVPKRALIVYYRRPKRHPGSSRSHRAIILFHTDIYCLSVGFNVIPGFIVSSSTLLSLGEFPCHRELYRHCTK